MFRPITALGVYRNGAPSGKRLGVALLSFKKFSLDNKPSSRLSITGYAVRYWPRRPPAMSTRRPLHILNLGEFCGQTPFLLGPDEVRRCLERGWSGSTPAERGIPADGVWNGDADIDLLPPRLQLTTTTPLYRYPDRAPEGRLGHLRPAVRAPHCLIGCEQLSAGGAPVTLRFQECDEVLNGTSGAGP